MSHCERTPRRTARQSLLRLCTVWGGLLCRFALKAGVAFNLDNFQELERTASILAADSQLMQQPDPNAHPRLIGLRINPQVSNFAGLG